MCKIVVPVHIIGWLVWFEHIWCEEYMCKKCERWMLRKVPMHINASEKCRWDVRA